MASSAEDIEPTAKKAKTAEAESSESTTSATFVAGEKPGAGGASSGAPSTPEEVAAAVLKQVEYYFSDANFPKDKFLVAETAKDKEQWVNISVLATFNRMKALVPSLDIQLIADALKTSTALEISEDGVKVRREKGRWIKSLGGAVYCSRMEVINHAKGLIEAGKAAPEGELSAEAQAFVLDLLKAHANPAEKEGAGVKAVKVGCNPEFPETSCFVIVRVDGTEVDFSYLKCVSNLFPEGAPRPGDGKGRGSKRKAEEGGGGGGGGDNKKQAHEGDTETEAGVSFVKGCIVAVKELTEGQDVLSLRAKFEGEDKSGGVKFVELVPDAPLAYVRFDSAESAAKALAAGCDVGTLSMLEGDEETQYWDKIGRGGKGKGKGGGKGKGKGKGGKGKGRGGKGGRGGRGKK